MEYDNPLFEKIGAVGKKLSDFVEGTFFRLVVHAFSVIIAGIGVNHAVVYEGHTVFGAVFTFSFAYVGLVCLFPRGMGLNPEWLIPTCTGFLHAAFMLAFGLPWETTLFWAGLQTWLMRVILNKGKVGWEWAAMPWLAAGALSFLSSGVLPFPRFTPPLLLIPATGLGLSVAGVYKKFFLAPFYKKRLFRAKQLLGSCLKSSALPKNLESACWQLLHHGTVFLQFSNLRKTEERVLAQEFFDVSQMLNKAALRKGDAGLIEKASLRTEKLNIALEQHLEESMPVTKDSMLENASMEEKNRWFYSSALELNKKSKAMPLHLRQYLTNICTHTHVMVDTAGTDTYKVKQAQQFLIKYLPYVHKIIEDYQSVLKSSKNIGANTAALDEIMHKSEDLLARLSTAFMLENQEISKNNTLDLQAELNVLDTLLKMQGR